MADLDGDWLLMSGEEEIGRLMIAGDRATLVSDPAADCAIRFEGAGAVISIKRDGHQSQITATWTRPSRGVVEGATLSASAPLSQPVELVRIGDLRPT